MSTLPFQSAKQLASLIRRKKIGALELLDLYLQRVQDYNDQINAIVVTQIDAARERAHRADQASAKGERWGPLTVHTLSETDGLRSGVHGGRRSDASL